MSVWADAALRADLDLLTCSLRDRVAAWARQVAAVERAVFETSGDPHPRGRPDRRREASSTPAAASTAPSTLGRGVIRGARAAVAGAGAMPATAARNSPGDQQT